MGTITNKKVIGNRYACTMKNAGVSERTREALVLYAQIEDLSESICKWYEKYFVSASPVRFTDEVCGLTSVLSSKLEEAIMMSIRCSVGEGRFKEI